MRSILPHKKWGKKLDDALRGLVSNPKNLGPRDV
jgi:hypothetical protein